MPKISLIIPIYNGERYLKQCVESILAQTFEDFEVVFVDDCSPDSSVKMLEEYSAKDKRIKIIHNRENIGQGASRNVGIEHSQGDYLMFQDQDDWFENTAFEECYKQISSNKNDYVMFPYNNYYQETGEIKVERSHIKPFENMEKLNVPDIKLYELSGHFLVSCLTWCQIYNAKFVKSNNIRYSSLRNGEDVPFYIKAWANAETISVIDKPLYNYRRYDEQNTIKLSKNYVDLFTVREESFGFVKQSSHANELLYPYLIYYIRSVLTWYRRNARDDKEIRYGYYAQMHKLYKELNEKYNISLIKEYIDYKKFIKYKSNNILDVLKIRFFG